MKLAPMRFKDYVWPHNPRIYEIRYTKDIASRRVPFGLYTLQNMGRGHRVLRGEGEFSGPGAYLEFKKLATVFYDWEPGVLVHPLWDAATAYFAALELRQEPTEDYVKYAFEFWECYTGYREGISPVTETGSAAAGAGGQGRSGVLTPQRWRTVEAGETGWGIAAAEGLSLSRLLELNPQLRNPGELCAGDSLRVE